MEVDVVASLVESGPVPMPPVDVEAVPVEAVARGLVNAVAIETGGIGFGPSRGFDGRRENLQQAR